MVVGVWDAPAVGSKRPAGSTFAAVLTQGTKQKPPLSAAAQKKQKLRKRRKRIVDALRVVLRDNGIRDLDRANIQTLLEHTLVVVKDRKERGEECIQTPACADHVLWRQALLDSEAMIALEVGVERYEVLASSRAMHTFAPISPLLGYLGQRLGMLVHQDDWPVLKDFRERLVGLGGTGDSCELGDVVSLRLLRNFKDDHTDAMIFEYVRLSLEVGHVFRDEGGSAVRVLFTCVPDAGKLRPRGRDAAFWQEWYAQNEEYVGLFQPDLLRTTTSPLALYKSFAKFGISLKSDQLQSTLAGFLGVIGSSVQASGTAMWTWLTKKLAHVMKICIVVERGKDQITPKLQGSTSLCFLGFATDWRTFLNVDLAGNEQDIGTATYDGLRCPAVAQFGVLMNEGLSVVGAMSLSHTVLPDGRRICRGLHKSFLDLEMREHSELILMEERGGNQKRFDFKLTGIARPPDVLRARFRDMLHSERNMLSFP
eukprot:CAMPEP_0206214450 /NCGR_PEP_ID=MMETSP0047_2-20121206/1672_1 /ASSEMBLY_ACC=CAM_ASM_000192 /TAXON_ID=195065 /ORGANISM="Chroomonas mesostigmatica_cf, Strain CCMP1168" /LENGTH=481 /DNA_ID=CAMNT_0053636687 /DNA_START=41 /DNA_END=1486 /DNA_ORIENTATION=-